MKKNDILFSYYYFNLFIYGKIGSKHLLWSSLLYEEFRCLPLRFDFKDWAPVILWYNYC